MAPYWTEVNQHWTDLSWITTLLSSVELLKAELNSLIDELYTINELNWINSKWLDLNNDTIVFCRATSVELNLFHNWQKIGTVIELNWINTELTQAVFDRATYSWSELTYNYWTKLNNHWIDLTWITTILLNRAALQLNQIFIDDFLQHRHCDWTESTLNWLELNSVTFVCRRAAYSWIDFFYN